MIKVTLPCSSANIGPGFDCLGIAFDIYNSFTFEESTMNEFIGFHDRYCDESNLVYKAFKWTLARLNKPAKKVKITFKGDIPPAHGLGSSSTCIIAGVIAAYEFSEIEWGKNDIAYFASLFEGHSDNVAACLYGGFTSSIIFQESLIVKNFPVSEKYKFFALIPNFELSTKLSREAVPKTTLLVNAKRNLANVSMLMKAFETGDSQLLSVASSDYLHQPYRGMLISGYFQIYQECINSNVDAVFLSGAGPTMLAVATNDVKKCLEGIVSKQSTEWKIVPLKIDYEGMKIERA